MDKKLVARIIPAERKLAWLMTLFAAVTILTGYALTKGWSERAAALDAHLLAEWAFIALFILHVIVNAIIIRFPLLSAIRGILKGKADTFAWMKVILVISGWASLISLFLVVASGMDWYAGVGSFLPFAGHMRYDLFLTLSMIIHVAAGAKLLFLRKGIKNRLIDYVLLAVVIMLVVGVIYIDGDGFAQERNRTRGGSMEIKPAIPVGGCNIHPMQTSARYQRPTSALG